jgi:hypothetical protein
VGFIASCRSASGRLIDVGSQRLGISIWNTGCVRPLVQRAPGRHPTNLNYRPNFELRPLMNLYV